MTNQSKEAVSEAIAQQYADNNTPLPSLCTRSGLNDTIKHAFLDGFAYSDQTASGLREEMKLLNNQLEYSELVNQTLLSYLVDIGNICMDKETNIMVSFKNILD